jgi:hypothetical protein
MAMGVVRAAVCVLLAAAWASADDDGYHPFSSFGPTPTMNDSASHPFSNFGKDIPGYKAPSIIKDKSNGMPNMAAHPLAADPPALVPFTLTGEAAKADGSKEGEGADEKEEVLTDSDRRPVDEDGKPVDVEREDAQANFHTLVEAFVAKNKDKDCWPVHDAKRALCLTYLSTDSARLRKVMAGVYSGVVVLRDTTKGANVVTRFTVDFTGEEWSVLLVQMLGHKDALFHRGVVKPEDITKRHAAGTIEVTVTPPDAKH